MPQTTLAWTELASTWKFDRRSSQRASRAERWHCREQRLPRAEILQASVELGSERPVVALDDSRLTADHQQSAQCHNRYTAGWRAMAVPRIDRPVRADRHSTKGGIANQPKTTTLAKTDSYTR